MNRVNPTFLKKENKNDSDAPFAVLLSMGYSEMYILRAIKLHKKGNYGTNWKLSVLTQIIDQLQTIDWQNENKYCSNLIKLQNTNSNHQYSKSLNLPPSPKKQPNLSSEISSEHELLYMKAVSLYENKHYEECERLIKDVLRRDPNHSEALLLYKDLVEQRLTRYKNYNFNSDKPIKQKRNSVFFGIANKKKKVIKKRKNTIKDSNNSDHPCRIEFRRFLMEHIQLNAFYGDLEDKFVSAKYDDIRILKDFDVEILEKIGLQPLHCKLFMKKVQIFISQVQIFQKWLASFVDKCHISINLLIDCLENYGIVTFDTLYRHIKCVADLDEIMQNNVNINVHDNISPILWNEMKLNKCVNKKKHNRSKTMEIHNDRNHSHAVHWGFTNDGGINREINNEEKLNDDEFIAALSPAAKSIEDMFILRCNSSNITKTNDAMSISSYNNYGSEEMESGAAYI